jgi:anti-sigma B factor antagonist
LTLEIRKEPVEPDIVVLNLSGRIGMGPTSEELERAIQELIQQNVAKVIVNLADVQRVDSTGFGILVTSSQKLKRAGGEMRVVGAHGIVEEIAHSSQIPRIVPFHATLADAVAAFTVC